MTWDIRKIGFGVAHLAALRFFRGAGRMRNGRPRHLDHDQIRRLKAEGFSVREIARQLGCGITTVRKACSASAEAKDRGVKGGDEDYDPEDPRTAFRRRRPAGHRVEAPPPARRTPAIEWDEFVGGYRAGLIEWNVARLGPRPGEPGCRAPADILKEICNWCLRVATLNQLLRPSAR
jgi:hypothetical protein